MPFALIGGAIRLSVTIGNLPVDMVLDTGATISTVSASLADRLIAEGQASEQPAITIRLANGSTATQRTVTVNSLTVADAHAVLAPALEGFTSTPEMPEIALKAGTIAACASLLPERCLVT
jgi:hypothetical protein